MFKKIGYSNILEKYIWDIKNKCGIKDTKNKCNIKDTKNKCDIKDTKNATCKEALDIHIKFAKYIVNDIILMNISQKDMNNDYKMYGLYPGQQIKRYFYHKIEHAAIYLYAGIIIEMGSGPKKCKKDYNDNNENIIGLHTLNEFISYSKKSFGLKKIVKIVTSNDNNIYEIKKRLKRAIRILGHWKYNAITSNCLQACNYVTFGTFTMFPKEKFTEEIL